MWLANAWQDFELIDAGDGDKLERWGDIVVRRPDPQAIWPAGEAMASPAWLDGHYHRSPTGGGQWEFFRDLPERWTIAYRDLRFSIGTMGFKHTGLFPEQAVNWDWMADCIRKAEGEVEVLNLFAYTGGATVACAKAGAKVVHVDAAKGMVQWARDNMAISGMTDHPVRYIVDDCMKFVLREQRRGRKYRAILMDPPSYGRGPDGEMWKMEDKLYELVEACTSILEDPVFFLINSYTTGLSATVLSNVLKLSVGERFGGYIESDEIGLPITSRDLVLPCGASGPVAAMTPTIPVLYEDNHLLVVVKPPNVPTQADDSGDADMLTLLKAYVKEKYAKPGEVYLGLVHRLDRPVGGVMVFARTSKAASRLSEQIREGQLHKEYFAVVGGTPPSGRLTHWLLKDEQTRMSKAVPEGTQGALRCELICQPLHLAEGFTLCRIHLLTGRSHQIRVQLSAVGCPLWGDARYNPTSKPGQQIALWSRSLSLQHPTAKVEMHWSAPLPIGIPWSWFEGMCMEE